jgi:uncharacterized protein YggE
MSKRSYRNYLEDPIIKGFILTVEPKTNLNTLNRDILLEIIARNISIFIPLLQTNKQLANVIESDPNIYFLIYKEVFRDECMILNILTNDELMNLIEKYNNNKYMRESFINNSCSENYVLDKNVFSCPMPMGSIYNINSNEIEILEKYNTHTHDESIKNSQRREDIIYFSKVYIKSKSIAYLNELLRNENVIYYLSELNDPRKFEIQTEYITNTIKSEQSEEEERYEIAKLHLEYFINRFPLQLPHAEFCFKSNILLISYFYKIGSLIGYSDNHLNLSMYTLSALFFHRGDSLLLKLNIFELEHRIFDYLLFLSKMIYNNGIENEIILEYIKHINLPSHKSGITYTFPNISYHLNIKTLKELINIHKNIMIDIQLISKRDDIYYKTIDYLQLKEKVCNIAEYENCNSYWKSLLLKTFALYMQDQGRRSSHYLMKNKLCLNCKKHDQEVKYDSTLFTYFCKKDCQNEIYKKLEKLGWNIDFNSNESTLLQSSSSFSYFNNSGYYNRNTNPQTNNILTVNGKGKVRAIPDKVKIYFNLVNTSKTSSEVYDELIPESESIKQKLELLKKESKIDKISIDNINVLPIYEKIIIKERNEEKEIENIKEYKGIVKFMFETKIDIAGSVNETILNYDIKNKNTNLFINTLDYIVSESVMKEAIRKTIEIASQDANDKADITLKKLGLKRDQIVLINVIENNNDYESSQSVQYEVESEMGSNQKSLKSNRKSKLLNLSPNEQNVFSEIELHISYK